MIRKNVLALPVLLLALLFMAMAPAGEKAMVKIDGKEIKPEGTLKFKKDDTVYLECTGIKPGSDVQSKVKKAGVKWADHTFRVDDTGEVIGVMHMPTKKLKVSCTVMYYDADGTFNEVKFKFQTY